ncbi:MAG: hypothetical protein FGM24_09870 [Candidatus Kapabacteria bacterium]|nr:hypothetical protein [Candidatus Kapabacteria bacterium]
MTPKIDKRRRYVFGPVPRGAEHDADGDEMVAFAQVHEHGIAYPREYPGSYFHETLGVATFEEYLSRNPEGLKPGRRFFFYEQADDGTTALAFSGTMMPQRALGGLRDGELPQGTAQATPGMPIILQQGTPDRVPRAAYEEMIEAMRSELAANRDQAISLQRRVDDLQRSIIDAEQKRLVAEAALETSQQRHQQELEMLRRQHTYELDTLRQLHAKDVEILTQKAVEEATRTAQEALGDPPPSALEQGIELLSGLAPIISPIASKLGEAVGYIIDDAIERRRHRNRGGVGLPPRTDPRHEAAAPAGTPAHVVQPGEMNAGTPQPAIMRHDDAADLFNGGI